MRPRPSRAQPRRDMTTDEKTMALALSPMKIRYVAGSPDTRFAENIGAALETLKMVELELDAARRATEHAE